MTHAAPHPDEEKRLEALYRYGILDTDVDAAFDALARIATRVCKTPIAVINLVDRDRQWFKSEIGLGVRETPLDISICAHAILQPGLFIVPDTRDDPRFASNPLVTGDPRLRFYAGALLESDDGYPLGTLCVLDYSPRSLDTDQREILGDLARQVMLLMDLYRANSKQTEMLSELETAKERLSVLAATDHLTGLANRRAFNEVLVQEIARVDRHRTPASLLMADLDHFKAINDVHGHGAGDEALQFFADLCRRTFRASDVIGRWGGEEFIVLLPETTPSRAFAVAERLHEALAEEQPLISGAALGITVSIGLVELQPGRTADQTLLAVDTALYAAKENGRNQTATG